MSMFGSKPPLSMGLPPAGAALAGLPGSQASAMGSALASSLPPLGTGSGQSTFGGSASCGAFASFTPRFQQRLQPNDATLAAIEAFPTMIQARHRAEDSEQAHFGLNSLKWWSVLIQRDVGEYGAEAMVYGGMILFGRWQEKPDQQAEVEDMLRSIAKKAIIEWVMPSAHEWYGPIWEHAIESRFDSRLMAGLIQWIRLAHPELAEKLIYRLSVHNVDQSVEVQQLADGDEIALDVKLSEPFVEGLSRLRMAAEDVSLREVNEQLERLVHESLSQSQPETRVAHLVALRQEIEEIYAAQQSQCEAMPLSADGLPIGDALPDQNVVALKNRIVEYLQSVFNPHHAIIGGALEMVQLTALATYIYRQFGMTQEAEEAKSGNQMFMNTAQRNTVLISMIEHIGAINHQLVVENRFELSAEDRQKLAAVEQYLVRGDYEAAMHQALRGSRYDNVQGLALIAQYIAPLAMMQEAQGRVDAMKPVQVSLLPNELRKIGRIPGNDIVIANSMVSARHAEIQVTQEARGDDLFVAVWLRDLGSSNGTYVDGGRLAPGQGVRLSPGGAFYLAGTVVKNEVQESIKNDEMVVLEQNRVTSEWVLKAVKKEAAADNVPDPHDHPTVVQPLKPLNTFERLEARDIKTIPTEYRHLIPKPKGIVLFPRFHQMLNETAHLVSLEERIAVRFFGPPGTAKTTIPEMIAQRMGVPLLRVPFSKRTDPSDLEGLWTMEEVEGNYVPVFKEGAPTIAMEHGFHLVLDEPDLARPGVLAFLNNVTAPGEYAWVRKQNGSLVKIEVHPGYRVYATENGARELGREEHGKDFLRRFSPYYVGPWTQEEVAQVLADRFENANNVQRWDRKTTQALAYFHDKMRILADGLADPDTKQTLPPLGSGVGQVIQFTPRSILRLGQRLVAQGNLTSESLSRAIRAEYILPLADPADQELVWTQAQAIFANLGARLGFSPDEDGHVIGPKHIPIPTLEILAQRYPAIQRSLNASRGQWQGFTWTDQALQLADEILWNKSLGIDVMLLGGAGEGKTELPPQIARLLGQEYLQKTVSNETDEQDLVGGPGRVNGKIAFIPDVVTLATERGAVLNLDEYLLADTGKLESVMNPLMDATQALILRNPYRMIPRHRNTFIILTSNPPWGEYADRNEHSGAAMSRVAVINLTGDYAMQSADRRRILRGWFSRPVTPQTTPSVKKKSEPRQLIQGNALGAQRIPTPPSGFRAMISSQGIDRAALAVGAQVQVDLPVHPQIAARFGIPGNLVLDVEQGQLLERAQDSSLGPLSAGARDALKQYADYLTRRIQIEMVPVTGKVIKILYTLGEGHRADLGQKQICLGLAGLLGYPLDAALGAGKHEWAHIVIDRGHPKYDAHEVGRLYANVVGDPRMNEFVMSLRDDFARQIDALYQILWPEQPTPENLEVIARYLPHELFAHAVISFWRFGRIPPNITDQRVIDALDNALPILKSAFTLLPNGIGQDEIERSAAVFYQILDAAYPYYEALIPESMQDVLKRLEAGATPEELIQELLNHLQGQSQGDSRPGVSGAQGKPKSVSELQQLAHHILEQRAEQIADRFEPQDPEAFQRRKGQIAQAKAAAAKAGAGEEDDAQAAQSGVVSVSQQVSSISSSGSAMSAHEFQEMQRAREAALQQSLANDLYRKSVPAKAVRAAARLKRILPPGDPTYLDGYYSTGKRMDRNRAIQDQLSPMPSGKMMLRAMRPGTHDANIVLVSDVSGSMKNAGAADNAVIGSATAEYLSEHLQIRYGEILFGSSMRVAKPLGKPLQSYAKKNELLLQHQQAFHDRSISRGTNIREPLAAAIEMIRKQTARSNYILLITDGEEVMTKYPKTLQELEAEAEAEGICVLVLALGDAQCFVPKHFKHYRFAAPDGSDIPDRIIELFEEAHRARMGMPRK